MRDVEEVFTVVAEHEIAAKDLFALATLIMDTLNSSSMRRLDKRLEGA